MPHPILFLLAGFALLFSSARADSGDDLYNVSLSTLGATAKGTNSNFNKDWLPNNALAPGERRGGTIFDPFEGATIDIRLVIPVAIEAVEIIGLDYRGTRLVDGVDIFIEGEKVASAPLPDIPGKPVRIPAEGYGQHVRIVCTGGHPNRDLGNGRTGPKWGGFARIRVLSPTDIEALMEVPDAYQVTPPENAIADTMPPRGQTPVYGGEPYQTTTHPKTIWDSKDVERYKGLLETDAQFAEQFSNIRRAMDALITEPLNVPQPKKAKDGKWMHLPGREYGPIHNTNSLDVANLGTAYALTDDPKYAEYAKNMLLAYADVFPNYAPGNRPGFTHDNGKLFDQRLGDATALIQFVRGYDLIYNLPTMTDEERQHIEENFLEAGAEFIAANQHTLRAPTNWSAICTLAVLMVGYAAERPDLVELAMWGPRGSKDDPKGGVWLHFSERSISPDGMWSEGAMGYQGMAMQALVSYAEILWHHGIDMYSYRDAALKKLFDSPLKIAYPDMTAPAIHDSGRASIIGREAYLWEFGYYRYRDPKYLTILNKTDRQLAASFQQFPVSILYGEAIPSEAPAIEWDSVNLFDVGYGILRNTSANGTVSVLMDYGPNRSHGHPDKLNIDVYAFEDWLIPDPGMVWYEDPLYRNWYRTTLAHNTLVVDELDQMACDGVHLVYDFGKTIGIQRAMTSDAFAGVTIDRSIFVTQNYVADIFGAFAELPRTLDLAWHIRGEFATELETEPFAFKTPTERGYSQLTNVVSGKTADSWDATFTQEKGTARFIAAGGQDTQVIFGDGILRRENPKTIVQRRKTNQTIYGNVVELDYDGTDYVTGVTTSGSLEDGYGSMVITTIEGTDHTFAAMRPGVYSADGLTTDAAQAYVSFSGDTVDTLSIGGGTFLEVPGARIEREPTGLAYIETFDNGSLILGNSSTVESEVTVAMDGLDELAAFFIAGNEARNKRAVQRVANDDGSFTFHMPPSSRIELAKPGADSVYAFRQEVLRKVREEQEAAMQQAFNAAVARTEARAAEAATLEVPEGFTAVIQAEDFTAQEGGSVKLTSNKVANVGKSFAGWDNDGHWLEYTVEVPAEGYYNLTILYCSQLLGAERTLKVNGVEQEPFAKFVLPATGGWANQADDWKLATLMNPTTEQPLLIRMNAGKNTLRLTNTNGKGANMDYLMVTSPDVVPERLTQAFASK